MKIEKMTTVDEFIDSYPFMEEIPLANGSARLLLSYCLSGEYIGLKLIKDDMVVGYVFYYIEDKTCKIIGLWCKNNFTLFRDALYAYAKKLGCKKVRAISKLEDKAYMKVMGMRKMYSVYEKRLGGK